MATVAVGGRSGCWRRRQWCEQLQQQPVQWRRCFTPLASAPWTHLPFGKHCPLLSFTVLLLGTHCLQVDPDLPLKDHAFQTAELCRLAHPDHDWLHLVGLIHGLGKLLAHRE